MADDPSTLAATASGSPQITVTAAAKKAFREVSPQSEGDVLRLEITSANGVTVDFVQTSDGGVFKIKGPTEPHAVKGITATDLNAWFEQGRKFELFDVRPDEERALAKIDRARPLDPSEKSKLLVLDKKTPLIFHCHQGARGRNAAADAIRAGFHEVYNLEGGIDAWSLHVDPSVPRY